MQRPCLDLDQPFLWTDATGNRRFCELMFKTSTPFLAIVSSSAFKFAKELSSISRVPL